MEKLPVIPAVVLLAVGVSAAVLWRQLDRAPAPEPAAHEAAPVPDTAVTLDTPGAAAPVVSTPRVTTVAVAASNTLTFDVSLQDMEIRRALTEMYPALAQQLELPPEEAGKFFDLLARQQSAMALVTKEGDLEMMARAAEGEQAAMLGNKYPQWLEYREAELQRDPVDKLQNMLATQQMSLPGEVVNPLVDALAVEQNQITKDLMSVRGARDLAPRDLLRLQLQNSAADNRRLSGVAAGYLYPQQLEMYERMLQQRASGLQRKLRTTDRNSEADEAAE